jgi:hypothetical protein
MSNDVVWVQMTITISGGRADGRAWPDRWGAPIDIPADEAWPLIRAGNAVEVPAPEGAAGRSLPPPASQTPAPQSEPSLTGAGPVATPAAETVSAETPVSFAQGGVVHQAADDTDDEVPVRERPDFTATDIEPPKPADPKQAWVDHAMAHGEGEDEANMQTKAALMQKYGGRL